MWSQLILTDLMVVLAVVEQGCSMISLVLQRCLKKPVTTLPEES